MVSRYDISGTEILFRRSTSITNRKTTELSSKSHLLALEWQAQLRDVNQIINMREVGVPRNGKWPI
jgi:hypothetical protein